MNRQIAEILISTIVTLLILLAMSLSWPAKAYGPTELPRYWQMEWDRGMPVQAIPDYEGLEHCKHAAAMWSANAKQNGIYRERSCEDFMVWSKAKGA